MKLSKILPLAIASVFALTLASTSNNIYACEKCKVSQEIGQFEEQFITFKVSNESGQLEKQFVTYKVSNATDQLEEQFVTLKVANEAGELIEVEFPKDPERVVVLNLQTLDFLDAMGLGDKIVGVIKDGVFPDHLQKYIDNEDIVNVGGMKSLNMEAIESLEPDVIFSSDRTKSKYQDLSAIAPTMAAFIDYEAGFMNSFRTLAKNHTAIFNTGDKAKQIIADYQARIQKIAEFAEGKTALLGIFTSKLNTLGDTSRCSIIVNEMNFNNLAADENPDHANLSAYESWLKYDPEYMFILDKNAAVGAEAVSAQEQIETNNPLIEQTQAYKNNKIIYLTPGNIWYMADGGITGMDSMISCIEEALGLK
ncbi:MAG: hypothetical protein ATN31_09250 [Candidatus Epulonipiscioides saccharophilum]|nr:MAG: hypothetical protein ATN31_09250 [Epulopiscium sp. AS2M-Bin001]